MPPKKRAPPPAVKKGQQQGKKEEKIYKPELNGLDKLYITRYLGDGIIARTETTAATPATKGEGAQAETTGGGNGESISVTVPAGTQSQDMTGIQWDEVEYPDQAIRDGYFDLLMKMFQDNKGALKDNNGGKPLAPGDPRYRVGLLKQALEWDQLEIKIANQKVMDLFTNRVPLSKVRGQKENYQNLQDVQQLVSKKVIGSTMAVLALAAAVWYRQCGESGTTGTLVLEVDNWANFVSASPQDQEKCAMWIKWVPEQSYAAYPDDFGSESYHKAVRGATHPTASTPVSGFNMVARDGTSYRWNQVAIPHLPQLLEMPKLQSFIAKLSVPGKWTLGVHTMPTETALLLGAADVAASPNPSCEQPQVSYIPLPREDLAQMNVKKIKKELRERGVTDNSDCATSEDLRKKLAGLRSAGDAGKEPESNKRSPAIADVREVD